MTGDPREPCGAVLQVTPPNFSARPGIDAQMFIVTFRHLLFVLLLRLRGTNVDSHFSASSVCLFGRLC